MRKSKAPKNFIGELLHHVILRAVDWFALKLLDASPSLSLFYQIIRGIEHGLFSKVSFHVYQF